MYMSGGLVASGSVACCTSVDAHGGFDPPPAISLFERTSAADAMQVHMSCSPGATTISEMSENAERIQHWAPR